MVSFEIFTWVADDDLANEFTGFVGGAGDAETFFGAKWGFSLEVQFDETECAHESSRHKASFSE